MSISALSVAVRGMDRGSFELRGTILPEDGIMLTDGRVGIQLQALSGTWQGKELSATPDHAGRFRFKKVPTGMYLLSAFVPRVTRVRRTVEVGPSLADGEGRIEVSIRLAARRRRPAMFEVPASALTIPAAARGEYEKGEQQLKDRNWARAEEHYRRATEWAPQYYAAWYQRASIAADVTGVSEPARSGPERTAGSVTSSASSIRPAGNSATRDDINHWNRTASLIMLGKLVVREGPPAILTRRSEE